MWIDEGILGRKSQFSLVIVYQTDDPKRYEQFLDFLRSFGKEVYMYIVWRGLFRVNFNGRPHLEPVSVQSDSPLLPTMGVRSLDAALDYMDKVFRDGKNVVFVVYGLFQKNDNFISALRAWNFDYQMYERGHTVVVFTECPQAIFDEATLKYFTVVKVPSSTERERAQIIGKIAETLNLKKRRINQLVGATAGLNLHEVESVLLKSLAKYRDLNPKAVAEYKNEIIKKSGVLDIETAKHGFEAVGGYEVVKAFIRNNVIKVLQNPKKAEKLGIRPPRGLLLFGLPGTGKTLFARALAKELELPFLRMRTENIVSRWYGETERSMARALELAEEVAPCVLFIDEIDRFGQRGKLGEHEATRRTFSILLEWLGDESRKTIVVATTNKPQDLDEAFIRVGRFDYLIPVFLPDVEARKRILEVHTSVVRKVPLKGVDLSDVAERTESFTGAELEELVLRAARNALKEDRDTVTSEDFEHALMTFRINRDLRQRQVEEYIRLANQFCNDSEFLMQLMESSGLTDRVEILKRDMEW